MRTLFVALAVGAVMAVPMNAGSAEARSTTPNGEFTLSVKTEPAPTTGEVIFSAVLTNKTTETVISAPKVTFKAGTGAVVRSGNEAEGTDLKMVVSSDVEKDTATVAVEYKVNEVVVFAPTITLPLK